MATEKHDCSESVWVPSGNWGFYHACKKPGKVQDDKGFWWCALHSPEGEQKRKDKWQAKYEADRKQRQLGYQIAAVKERIVKASLQVNTEAEDNRLVVESARELLDAIDELKKLYAQEELL